MLEESRKFNDYDYALVHLFEQNQEYYKFYKKSVELGRHVLLDNSLFELGEAFDSEKFAFWINQLQPTEYVIPDSWENTDQTIENLHSWMNKYKSLPGKKIGVCQGKTYEDFVRCYQELDKYVDKIAISFGYSYYLNCGINKELGKIPKDLEYSIGRQKLINKLLLNNVINTSKPHHLLGTFLPSEFSYYNINKPVYNFIESIDTSSPIVHGFKKIKYEDFGLYKKDPIKMVEIFYEEADEEQKEIINYNVKKFREINLID